MGSGPKTTARQIPTVLCFNGTTNSGTVETESKEIVAITPPTPAIKAVPEQPVPEPVVIKPLPEDQTAPKEDDADVAEVLPETQQQQIYAGTEHQAEPTAVTPAKPWTPSPLTLWVVHPGEHLWGISAHRLVYGDPYKWPLLFKRNRYQIKDADLVYPGQVLHIERDLTEAEIRRAIEHARTRGPWILGITETH